MSAEPLRVGLIGFGLAGRVFHGPLLAADPAFEVAAVVTSNAERQADARMRHPGAEVLQTSEELLALADDLDLVVIASPPMTHVALAMAGLDAGLGVVVDKPVCATPSEAASLVERAETSGGLLTVFQNRRWDSDFLTLRRVAAAGQVGEIRQLESRFERWKPQPDGSKPWRVQGPDQAGGIVYDLGSHLVDQAIELLGPVDDIHAELASYGGTSAPDDAFISLRHVGGARSRLWMSSVAAQPGPRFRILGSRGAFVSWGLDVQEQQLAAGVDPRDPEYGLPPESQWPVVGVGDSAASVRPERGDYPAFYAGVAQALSSEDDVPVDPRDCVEVVRVLAEAHSGWRSVG